MSVIISHSPAETEALGERIGQAAKRGWVIALSGDLGAGKTQFVKGLARGLGISARVHSPTFTLVAEYRGGRLALFHLDLYRLETAEQILSAGIEEFLQPDGVAVIEWAERLEKSNLISVTASVAGQESFSSIKKVQFEILNETDRKIVYDDFAG